MHRRLNRGSSTALYAAHGKINTIIRRVYASHDLQYIYMYIIIKTCVYTYIAHDDNENRCSCRYNFFVRT